jgi:CzcA family heavy metal efflux pump
MFQSIVETSLRRRSLVLVLVVLFLAYGTWTAARTELDVLPDFSPPQAVVQTEAPGLAPEQVEQLVTRPIETAIGGAAGLVSLRSESIQGLSVVTVVFSEDVDVFRARQLLAESLADAALRLPGGVGPPRVAPLTSATMDVLKIGLLSQQKSAMELRSFADWTIRPRLLMVPGVARINVFGGEVRQIQVQVDPSALAAHGLSFADLVAATRAAVVMPGAGFVDTPGQRIVIAASNLGSTVDAIGAAVVATGTNGAVALRDVASVVEAPAPAFGDASIQGEPGVLLTLSGAYGTNTLDVTRGLEAALDDLKPLLEREGITVFPRLHRPADFIETSLANLRSTLLVGALLVAIVLLFLTRDARAAAISLTAIPLSLLAAVVLLSRFGLTLDTMSLGGLAIAIGEVVDDAIIDVENIQRRLRENAAAGHPRADLDVVLDASLEVRTSVVFATLAVAVVFLPLLTLQGIQGRFFSPLATSYLVAVVASLGTALVVTPALALVAFSRRPPAADAPAIQVRLRTAYRRLLARVESRPWHVAAPVVGIVVAAFAALPLIGGDFIPAFRENHLVLQVTTLPGTSLAEVGRIGTGISKRVLELAGVRTIEQQIGRAEAGEDTWGPNRSEFHVELTPGGDHGATTDRIRAILESTPGIQSEILTFLGDRISETVSGETAAVVVSIFSEDLDVLDARATDVAHALGRIRGAVDVASGTLSIVPETSVRLQPERLASHGLRAGDVLDQVQTAFSGTVVGQVSRGDRPIEVNVILSPTLRDDPMSVGALLVTGPRASVASLADLADVSVASGRESVSHEGGRRRQTITCNVRGRDVTGFTEEARARIAREVELPAGSYFVVGGDAEARAAAVRDLCVQAGVGGIGVLVLLSLATGDLRNVAILAAGAPVAIAGGIIATIGHAIVTGVPVSLSIGSLVGLVTLFGITIRHGIMMFSHFARLVGSEGRPWNLDTALAGAEDRVVPVLMTLLVTALALLPVALRANEAGAEIDGPLAIAILGGLALSTVTTLLLLPVAALRFGRFGRRDTEGRDVA